MSTPGCLAAGSACPGASLSLAPVVVTTAASSEGEVLSADSSCEAVVLDAASAGGAVGAAVLGRDRTLEDRLGAAAESNSSSPGLAAGAAGASTGPERSCSSSSRRLGRDSTYTRSAGAELGFIDSTPATPIVSKSTRCRPTESAPAHAMRRLGDSGAPLPSNASRAAGSTVFSSADVGTLLPRACSTSEGYSRQAFFALAFAISGCVRRYRRVQGAENRAAIRTSAILSSCSRHRRRERSVQRKRSEGHAVDSLCKTSHRAVPRAGPRAGPDAGAAGAAPSGRGAGVPGT